MRFPIIRNCPATLAEGHLTFSRTALRRMFNGRKISHVLPYHAPFSRESMDAIFANNPQQLSISGVQEKFSVVLDQHGLRLVEPGERGQYILKPIPIAGKNTEQMPANEHLTMQIARQVFKIETAENALVFFGDGSPAFITKRFDIGADGQKRAQEDFASLAARAPSTHGEHYKYFGNYFQLFEIMRLYVPAYPVEALKLFRLLVFNFLMSNGDAHFKNFSLLETTWGDNALSPAYDLLNTRIHINDRVFALDEGLLPPKYALGNVRQQFFLLGEMAGISHRQLTKILADCCSHQEEVSSLIHRSYLSERFQRNYEQAYRARLKKLREGE